MYGALWDSLSLIMLFTSVQLKNIVTTNNKKINKYKSTVGKGKQ